MFPVKYIRKQLRLRHHRLQCIYCHSIYRNGSHRNLLKRCSLIVHYRNNDNNNKINNKRRRGNIGACCIRTITGIEVAAYNEDSANRRLNKICLEESDHRVSLGSAIYISAMLTYIITRTLGNAQSCANKRKNGSLVENNKITYLDIVGGISNDSELCKLFQSCSQNDSKNDECSGTNQGVDAYRSWISRIIARCRGGLLLNSQLLKMYGFVNSPNFALTFLRYFVIVGVWLLFAVFF